MRAGISAAIVAAALLGTTGAWSACPPGQFGNVHPRPGQARGCLDLNLVPQATHEIVAGEPIAAPPKTAPAAAAPAPYTGPTVGVSRTVRQTPTVGYRWAID
jgi:hypothetical protein